MPLDLDHVRVFIEQNIQLFHQKRIESIQTIKLITVLKRKNPYLFRAKNLVTASDLVKTILDAFLSSQEEGIFSGFLEQLAIFICNQVYAGRKSAATGVDLEFDKANVTYIVAIKSGPNWGNSSQIQKMKDDFRRAKKVLGTNRTATNVVAINGCCYGRDATPDKGEYLKLCGQSFWEFVSGDQNLYIDIIEPLGHKAHEQNEMFNHEYAKVVNKFTAQFINVFCDADGAINWDALIRLNSATIQ